MRRSSAGSEAPLLDELLSATTTRRHPPRSLIPQTNLNGVSNNN